jgi:hypothetical protein
MSHTSDYIQYSRAHSGLASGVPYNAPSTQHTRHADAKGADIITIACEVEPTQSQSARPSLKGWRMARRRARYEHRESSGQAADRNRHQCHHHPFCRHATTDHSSTEDSDGCLTELTEQTELPGRGVRARRSALWVGCAKGCCASRTPVAG